MSGRAYAWGLLAAFVLQTALVAWLIVDRALLLKNGEEIRLAVVPVDPRDLLRGDYVILSYEISRLATDELEGDDDFFWSEPIYVSLAKGADGWQATAVHHTPPESGLYLKGTIEDVQSRDGCPEEATCSTIRVVYNLEQFFVPEGEGRDLETLRNDQRMSVDVAVASGGRAALKRLLVDDEVRYEETLY